MASNPDHSTTFRRNQFHDMHDAIVTWKFCYTRSLPRISSNLFIYYSPPTCLACCLTVHLPMAELARCMCPAIERIRGLRFLIDFYFTADFNAKHSTQLVP